MRTIIAFVVLLVIASAATSASAQPVTERRPVFTASLETTVSSVAETSFKATAPSIVREGRRWRPAEKIVQLEAQPGDATFTVRFTLGDIDEPPIHIDPQNGIRRFDTGIGLSYLTGYLGSTKQLEVGGAYNLTPYLKVQGNYLKYSLEDRQERFEPAPGFNQGGWYGSYWEINRYRTFEFGVGADHTIEKLGLHGDLMWAPLVRRSWNSIQVSRGTVYENDSDDLGTFDDTHTQGLELTGRISYELARTGRVSVNGSFGYTYRLFRTSFEDRADWEDLTLSQATAGLHIGF